MAIASVIKALDTAIVVTALVILHIYVPTLTHLMRTRPVPKAAFLLLGIIMTWIGALVVYADIAIKLWLHQAAAAAGNASIATRLVYLILFLTGGAIHIAASQRERHGVLASFIAWSAMVAVMAIAVVCMDTLWAGPP